MKTQSLATLFALLVFGAVSACGQAAPQTPTAAPPDDDKALCARMATVDREAAEALAPVAATLAASPLSAGQIAKATDDLKATFTTMHLGVAAAAENASDPELKTKMSAYQYAVEQAIVAVEGADAQPAKLTAAIELPGLRDAKQGVTDSCAARAQ